MECNFSTFLPSVSCTINDLRFICDFQEEQQDNYLSTVGLLFSKATESFTICRGHREQIDYLTKLREKSKLCKVPTISQLVSHVPRRTAPHGDRKVNKSMMVKIHRSTGAVLPIGTSICTNCRKKLIFGADSAGPHAGTNNNALEEKPDEPDRLMIPSDPLGEYSKSFGEKTSEPNRLKRPSVYHSDDWLLLDEEEVPSESSQLNQPRSQASQCSSVCMVDNLQQLNTFLDLSDISPIKKRKVALTESSERTRNRCIEKALQCLTAACETICPGEGDLLRSMVCSSINQDIQTVTLDKTTRVLVDIFNSADTWAFRRQVLSILTENHSFQEMKRIIPELSSWQYYTANKHRTASGCGAPVPNEKIPRSKIDDSQLDHFLDYITSSHIVKDLPYGMKTLKLTTGEMVEVPNLIRCLAPASIISQYSHYCKEESFKHLGSSTMFKILNDCSALVRKSIEGLDYYVAEGGRAFSDVEEIVDQLNITEEKSKSLKTKLLNSKRYIKSDFKLHIQTESTVADHCRCYGLSDMEKVFSKKCSHAHSDSCKPCTTLTEVLDEVLFMVERSTWDNKDAVMFKLETAVQNILEWRRHIVRARNQENARVDLLAGLKEDQVLMTCDWAMKFLPRKFREGQTDWFAKRGINWHITVTVTKSGEEIKTLTHVHLFSSQVSQDGSVTASMVIDVVKDLQTMLPEIEEIHLFSDNAGCYKNTQTMVVLHNQLGPKLKTYNFSEAQDGKGPCDRRASHLKSCIKRYINEGNNVTTAEEMKVAIDAKQNGTYRVKVVDAVIDVDTEKEDYKPIPLISQLHNFAFESRGIRVLKAYGIGKGKLIKWNKIGRVEPRCELMILKDWTASHFQTLEREVTGSDESEDIEEVPLKKRKKDTDHVEYDCPKEGCMRLFKSATALEQHITLGNCDYRLEKHSLHDEAKLKYYAKVNLMPMVQSVVTQESDKVYGKCSSVQLGWALRQKKKKSKFSAEQKKFMKRKFEGGKKSGRKVDPFVAAEEMRSIKSADQFVFSKAEYLTGQQISSYFSRLALKNRKTDMNDLVAAKQEAKDEEITQDILDTVTL